MKVKCDAVLGVKVAAIAEGLTGHKDKNPCSHPYYWVKYILQITLWESFDHMAQLALLVDPSICLFFLPFLKVLSNDHCPIGVYGTLFKYTVDLQLSTLRIYYQCIFLSFALTPENCEVLCGGSIFFFYCQCNNQCKKFSDCRGKWISLKSLTFRYGHLPLWTLVILMLGYKRRDIYHWKVNSCQLSRHHQALQTGIVIGWHVM